MLLRCHTAFGYHEPGDEVEVPDGAVFDPYYYELAEPEPDTEPEAPVEADK